MKYEWRKKEKELYIPKERPMVIDVPVMNYLSISGTGGPGSEEFTECVGALYALSYGLKMTLKKDPIIDGHYDYTVFPLEGIWDLSEEGRQLYRDGVEAIDLKVHMTYTVMIRQPDFITPEVFETIRAMVLKKKKVSPRVNQVAFGPISEGKAVQMLHVGSYDDEPASFDLMEAYAKEMGLERVDKTHKEIYLSDPSKVAVQKLKTTLRFWVK